jgi:hypothetical protein
MAFALVGTNCEHKVFHLVNFIAGMQLIVSKPTNAKPFPFVMHNSRKTVTTLWKI